LEDIGSANKQKTQCLLFSATTPNWVQDIGRKYQENVIHIDSTTEEGGARVAQTVRHLAVQLPPGADAKKAVLEDIIAVEISKDATDENSDDEEELKVSNPLAYQASKNKKKSAHAMQQKIFGKTIVFTETKREADEIVSGGVFKSLTAQALHGDVSQKQRDSTLNAFRAGAFNVLVATDVAARGIDIRDVDLVVQLDPPRDVDTYVHRSGRTGRAGKKGISVLLFNPQQARDIVKIERDLGHGFQFDLVGPPSIEAALKAAARTSAIASKSVPDETATFFRDAAADLLEDEEDPVDVVSRCLAAISRRSTDLKSRSLITGELGMATVQMVNEEGRPVEANDVMFVVGKLARMSRNDETAAFESDVGRIQPNRVTGTAIFDMSVDDAKRLVEFSTSVDTGGNVFSLLKELEVERGEHFGRDMNRGGKFGGRERSYGGGGRGGGGGAYRPRERFGSGGGGGNSYGRGGEYRRSDRRNMGSYQPRSGGGAEGRPGGGGGGAGRSYESRRSYGGSGGRPEFRGRYDSRKSGGGDTGGW
jgi:ATP-dependent RNA helicase DDX21